METLEAHPFPVAEMVFGEVRLDRGGEAERIGNRLGGVVGPVEVARVDVRDRPVARLDVRPDGRSLASPMVGQRRVDRAVPYPVDIGARLTVPNDREEGVTIRGSGGHGGRTIHARVHLARRARRAGGNGRGVTDQRLVARSVPGRPTTTSP